MPPEQSERMCITSRTVEENKGNADIQIIEVLNGARLFQNPNVPSFAVITKLFLEKAQNIIKQERWDPKPGQPGQFNLGAVFIIRLHADPELRLEAWQVMPFKRLHGEAIRFMTQLTIDEVLKGRAGAKNTGRRVADDVDRNGNSHTGDVLATTNVAHASPDSKESGTTKDGVDHAIGVDHGDEKLPSENGDDAKQAN